MYDDEIVSWMSLLWGWAVVAVVASCTSEPEPETESQWRWTTGLVGQPYDLAFGSDGLTILNSQTSLSGTRNTLLRLGSGDVWEPFTPPPPPGGFGTLWAAPDGDLFWRATGGTFRLDAATETWTLVAVDPSALAVSSIYKSRNGTLYAACEYTSPFGTREARICFQRPGEGWSRGRIVELPIDSYEFINDAFGDGMRIRSTNARVFEGTIEAFPAISDMFGQLFALTADGNYLLGDSNYSAGVLWEVRPDGLGRSWVDRGCVPNTDLARGCEGGGVIGAGSTSLFFADLPVLAPSGVVYQIRREQNGSIRGTILRARPTGTKWEVVADGNPSGNTAVRLKVAPDGRLFIMAEGGGGPVILVLDEATLP
jgi:hypothetical protein